MNSATIIRRAAVTAALLVFTMGVSVAWAHGTPDQSNDPATGTSYSCPGGSGSLFQGLTPSRRLLSAVDLRMRKGGSFPGEGTTLTVRIHASDPSGSVVGAAASAVSANDPFTPLVHFDFSPPLALEPQGTFVIEFATVHPAVISWMGRNDNPYAGGTAYDCIGIASSQTDFNFMTHVPGDSGPPETSIDARRSPGSITRARAAQVSFAGTDDLSYPSNLAFACELDGKSHSPCSSPVSLGGLTDGRHMFSVRATDQTGKTDASPASVSWTVDGTAPSAPRVTGPRRLSGPRAIYRFSARDAVDGPRQLRYRCAVDSRRLSPCKARVARRLSRGQHVLRVVAVDRAGNESRTTVVRLVRA